MVAAGDRPPQDVPLAGDVTPYLTLAGPLAYGDGEQGNGDREPSAGLGPAEMLNSLRRQWLPGLLIGVCLAGVAAAAAWMLQKPKFTSTAFLRISARDAPLIFTTADQMARPDFKTYLATQQQLMLTPLVLNAALSSDELSSLPRVKAQVDPIVWLQEELKVQFEAEIGQVSFTDGDPNVAKAVVDGVVAAYMEEVVLAEEKVRQQRLDNLERVGAEAETKLRSKRSEMRRLVDTLGSGDSESLSLAQQSAIQEFGMFRSELTRVQFELMQLEGELELRQAAAGDAEGDQPATDETLPPAEPTSLALEQAIANDPVASNLIRELSRVEAKINVTRRRFRPETAAEQLSNYESQMKDLLAQLDERREMLGRNLAMSAPSGLQGAGPVLAGTPTEDLAFRIAVLKKQEQELLSQVSQRETEAKKFGRSSIDVEMMRSEISSLDEMLSLIGGEIERTKVELRSGTRTAVISPASSPQPESIKKRAAMAAMGGVGGLGLPLVLLMLLDLRRRRVDGVATITDRLRLDVLGVVPRIPHRALMRIGNDADRVDAWQERLAESISTVTAMVLRKAAIEDKRVILVSSAVAGEGKTTLAGQLGVRLAETGHRTLLVDFDLRRPALHAAFDAELEPGVADLLEGAVELADTIQPTDHPNLSLIAAGSHVSNILNAAAQGSLEELFRSLRPDYEFVIVDCSPVLPVVDTRLIGQFGDGIILSVLRDVSEAPKVAAARTILQSHGVPLIGTVVTGCSQEIYFESRQPALAAV
jgi:succinoglycan biosynthesis transport protein ExoP